MTNDGTDDNVKMGVEDDVIWIEQPTSTPRGASGAKRATPPPPHPSVAGLLQTAFAEGKTFLTAQVEIIKIKAKSAAKSIGAGIVMFLGAAVLSLYLLGWTFHTIELAFQELVAPWLAALITWGILLLLIILLLVVGVLLMKRGKDEIPDTAKAIKEDVAVLKEGLDK